MPNSPKTPSRKATSRNGFSPVERVRIAGGPTVVLVPMPGARSSAVSVQLRVGSRFERPADNGISHFLEHMLHRGTKNHPNAHAQALAFERLGGTLSASTTPDHGVLAVTVPPENLTAALRLLSDVCREPVFDSIELERGIVREEILEALDARGRRISPDDLLRDLAFPGHGLGRPITGTLTTLKRFDERALSRHHRAHYTTAMVVAVAGRVSRKAVLSEISRSFRLPPGRPPAPRAPRALRGPELSLVGESSSQTALRVGFRAPGERDADEPATELLMRVLDDGTSTRLYHRLCDERGLCYDVSGLYEAYQDTGLLDFAAECSHRNVPVVLDALFQMVRELRDEAPSDEEIDKARARHRFALEAMQDSPSDQAAYHGFAELTGVGQRPEVRIQRLAKVSRARLKAAARRIFRKEGLAVVAVGDLRRGLRGRLKKAVAEFS